YETLTGKYNAADSKAIIGWLKRSAVAYTEFTTPRTRFGGASFERLQNILPQGDFAARYRECARFVRRK
ncbi:MAG: hypothetical protein KGJ06_09365, partial [Pseudomonadota bacterium]|nr:hypothetical protein [Pseudomonadota bacterium]